MIINFSKKHRNIYPSEQELKKENTNDDKASVLDFEIEIAHKVTTELYSKREIFSLEIVCMPFWSSSTPSAIFYSTLALKFLDL